MGALGFCPRLMILLVGLMIRVGVEQSCVLLLEQIVGMVVGSVVRRTGLELRCLH
jgi:hypothetical protein